MSDISRKELEDRVRALLKMYKEGKIQLAAALGVIATLEEFEDKALGLARELRKSRPFASPVLSNQKIPKLNEKEMEKWEQARIKADKFINEVYEKLRK